MQNNSKNIPGNKYYLPTLPYLTSERSRKFFGIVMTLCALAFFGFFAIKPTVSTILTLQKELSDNQFVLDQLKTKIKNLTELRKQYFDLQNDISVVTDAIAIQPDTHLLFAQIQSIAKTSNVSIKKLQNFEVEVIKSSKNANKNYYSYAFAIAGSGSFVDISRFAQILTNMERVVNVDVFSISRVADPDNTSLGFNIQGTAFFKDNL